MNFFKRFFSSKKEQESQENGMADDHAFNADASSQESEERYEAENHEAMSGLFESSIKVVEGYFKDNKVERLVNEPVNHPANLDQTVDEGMGFLLYGRALGMSDQQILSILSLAFNKFMIDQYGFKIYKDHQPELPLRTMVLKLDTNDLKQSIYPLEYTNNVLIREAYYDDITKKIDMQLSRIPGVKNLMDRYINRVQESSGN